MTFSLIVLLPLLLVLVAATLLLRRARPASLGMEGLAAQIRSVNVDAFLNLMDDREKAFLRHNLQGRVFRKVHRERMLAAMQYVWRAGQNARLLIRLAEFAKDDSDSEIATIAQKLYDDAITLRLCCLQMLPRLALSAALPGRAEMPGTFADSYEATSSRFRTLTCLRVPPALSKAA